MIIKIPGLKTESVGSNPDTFHPYKYVSIFELPHPVPEKTFVIWAAHAPSEPSTKP